MNFNFWTKHKILCHCQHKLSAINSVHTMILHFKPKCLKQFWKYASICLNHCTLFSLDTDQTSSEIAYFLKKKTFEILTSLKLKHYSHRIKKKTVLGKNFDPFPLPPPQKKNNTGLDRWQGGLKLSLIKQKYDQWKRKSPLLPIIRISYRST